MEKKHHEKTILELAKVKHQNRELKKDIERLESKLQLKEKELDDMKSRFEMKNAIESKHHDRDVALFQRFIGKAPIGTNAYDAKVMSMIKLYQDQKEELEIENGELKNEIDRLQNITGRVEDENVSLKKEFGQTYDKLSKEVMNRVAFVENENNRLAKDNQALKERLEKFDHERNSLRDENFDLKRKYEDLREKLYALDLGTPNKPETKSPGASTPQANPLRSTKSFTTSKKSQDTKTSEREDKFSRTKSQFDLTDLSSNECHQLIAEVSLFRSET